MSHRVGRGLAQAAEAAAADIIGERFQLFQIVAAAVALAEPLQNLQHALGADAAEGTLAAGFGLREFQEEARDIHHAVAVVEHHQAARSHDGAGLRQRIVIDGRVGRAAPGCIRRRAAELHGFELPAVFDAAADLLHDFANGDAHGHFDQAAAVDLSGQREDLGSAAGRVCRRRAKAAAPWRMIHGTQASVSTLLMMVGLPRKPCSTG